MTSLFVPRRSVTQSNNLISQMLIVKNLPKAKSPIFLITWIIKLDWNRKFISSSLASEELKKPFLGTKQSDTTQSVILKDSMAMHEVSREDGKGEHSSSSSKLMVFSTCSNASSSSCSFSCDKTNANSFLLFED